MLSFLCVAIRRKTIEWNRIDAIQLNCKQFQKEINICRVNLIPWHGNFHFKMDFPSTIRKMMNFVALKTSQRSAIDVASFKWVVELFLRVFRHPIKLIFLKTFFINSKSSRTAREVRKNRTYFLIEYSGTFEPHLIVLRKQFFRLPLVPAWEHDVCVVLLLHDSSHAMKD